MMLRNGGVLVFLGGNDETVLCAHALGVRVALAAALDCVEPLTNTKKVLTLKACLMGRKWGGGSEPHSTRGWQGPCAFTTLTTVFTSL